MALIDDGVSCWNGENGTQKKEVGDVSQRHCRATNGKDLMRVLVDYQSRCTRRVGWEQRQQ